MVNIFETAEEYIKWLSDTDKEKERNVEYRNSPQNSAHTPKYYKRYDSPIDFVNRKIS